MPINQGTGSLLPPELLEAISSGENLDAVLAQFRGELIQNAVDQGLSPEQAEASFNLFLNTLFQSIAQGVPLDQAVAAAEQALAPLAQTPTTNTQPLPFAANSPQGTDNTPDAPGREGPGQAPNGSQQQGSTGSADFPQGQPPTPDALLLALATGENVPQSLPTPEPDGGQLGTAPLSPEGQLLAALASGSGVEPTLGAVSGQNPSSSFGSAAFQQSLAQGFAEGGSPAQTIMNAGLARDAAAFHAGASTSSSAQGEQFLTALATGTGVGDPGAFQQGGDAPGGQPFAQAFIASLADGNNFGQALSQALQTASGQQQFNGMGSDPANPTGQFLSDLASGTLSDYPGGLGGHPGDGSPTAFNDALGNSLFSGNDIQTALGDAGTAHQAAQQGQFDSTVPGVPQGTMLAALATGTVTDAQGNDFGDIFSSPGGGGSPWTGNDETNPTGLGEPTDPFPATTGFGPLAGDPTPSSPIPSVQIPSGPTTPLPQTSFDPTPSDPTGLTFTGLFGPVSSSPGLTPSTGLFGTGGTPFEPTPITGSYGTETLLGGTSPLPHTEMNDYPPPVDPVNNPNDPQPGTKETSDPPVEEDTLDIIEDSGSGGTGGGGTTPTPPLPVNTAPAATAPIVASFDGVMSPGTDTLLTGINSVSSDFTLEFNIKPTQNLSPQPGIPGSVAIFEKQVGNFQYGEDFSLSINTPDDTQEGTLRFFAANEARTGYAVDINGATTLHFDEWYHVAVVYDSSNATASIYLDGMLEASGSITGPRVEQNSPLTFGLGYDDTGKPHLFKGALDDIRLWSTARTHTEINDTLNRELTGNESDLTAYWNFNTTTGTTVPDVSFHGNNASFTGDVAAINENTVAAHGTFNGMILGTDAESDDLLSYSLKTNPAHGTVVLHDNLFDYTNTGGAGLDDSFVVTIDDGLDTYDHTVNIDVV